MIRPLTLLSALLSVAALAADPVAMFTPRALNLDAPEAAAIGSVCASKYAAVAQRTVIEPAVAGAAVGPNGSYVEAARALQASELVELTIVNLVDKRGRGRLLLNGVRRTSDGEELSRADVAADSMDDTLPACERLALALVNRVPVAAGLNRGNVTAAEMRSSNKPNRIGSEKVLGVKASFTAPLGHTAQGGLSFDARLEQERYFIELGVGFFIPASIVGTASVASGYGGIQTELGASYYLSTGDVAPYVGGGLLPRIVFSGAVINLAPYAQVGVMFWRQSSTRLYIDARVAQNVLAVDRSGQLPTEFTLQVGVGF